jgi:TonB family protein
VRPDDLLERFEIDTGKKPLAAGGRPEPILVPAPFLVEFEETAPLDTRRLDPGRARVEPEKPPSRLRQRLSSRGFLWSLAAHLLPLLALLPLALTPPPLPPPVPVQVVFEPPPPPPPPPKPVPKVEEPKKPPPGELTSLETTAPAQKPGPPVPAEPKTAEPKTAEPEKPAVPPPKPPHDLISALPKPEPPPEPALAAPVEPPDQEAKPPPKRVVKARPAPKPRPSAAATGSPGPSATHDEYLAYCMGMIRRYQGILSPGFIAGRRGVAVITVQVLDDGTIARVAVARSSGYSDIDERIERMVSSVRRFPPLPQWIQRPSVMLSLEWVFPQG